MKNKELIRVGEERLQSAGVPSAEVDAKELFYFVSGMDPKTYLLELNSKADEEVCLRYQTCVERRCRREPLQQITGSVGFMGMEFLVNRHVLCPRQDTELLVETVLSYINAGMKVLDLCTGSGCVLICVLAGLRGTFGLGVDISPEALAVAGENAKRLKSRARFVQGDLFEPVSGRFDIITCNPPYIPSSVIETLMPEVKTYEPRKALDGGTDGLTYYRRIIKEAREYLTEGGRLFFEIGVDQRVAVSALFEQEGYGDIRCLKDYADNDRVVSAKMI